MKKIYYLFLSMIVAICCISCNNEWEDEQYLQLASFKANVNSQGVTTTYVRYKPGGTVRYNLPVILSGSTMNSQAVSVRVALDPDTLAQLNKEVYGHREELYFQQLESKYYSMPETVEIPEGECISVLPIDFTLDADLDQADKWVLPLQIVDDPSLGYQANPRKYYRRAMLRLLPFNDYSGTYDASQYLVYIDTDKNNPFTVASQRAFVVDDRTIFIYAGTRDIDFLDRKLYKVFIRFPEEGSDTKKLEIWSDNPEINLTVDPDYPANFVMYDEMDDLKPYLKKIFITINLNYTFEDYTTIPGKRIKYSVSGALSMQRDLNTLIPDEDQQIQW
ncbi:MAG: DUF4973 domain-containing protein [Bacteroides thetaiotaomicron]|jgi:hypothetical protein|uniref:DUF4973 domain-containing protein n=1 Tax=Bacteroides thetaiotaomicron TaxID=818 RepID=A0A7J5JZ57_BACT4|nr:DUF4973 domain-containing protein [uncultured Bacteroides sp.]KAB4456546.1 DUF4973 domain-containing protein [Bacteroides thetaiotaomicron]